jgi:ketosteroid isomerase-like protein
MRETTMVTQGQQNLETVIFDYLGALREGDKEALRAALDPNVTWQGFMRIGYVTGRTRSSRHCRRGSDFVATCRRWSSCRLVLGW